MKMRTKIKFIMDKEEIILNLERELRDVRLFGILTIIFFIISVLCFLEELTSYGIIMSIFLLMNIYMSLISIINNRYWGLVYRGLDK